MNRSIITLSCLGLLVASLMGITMSVPLQASATILLGLAAVVASRDIVKGTGRVEPRWLFLLTLASLTYFLARAWLSPVRDLGMEDLMLILSAGALYFTAAYSRQGRRLREGLAWIVITVLLLHLGSVMIQLAGGEGYSIARLLSSTSRSSATSITGMYGYYGSYANFSVIAGALCICLGVWGRGHNLVRIALMLLGMGTWVMAVVSGSRAGVLSLLAVIAVISMLFFISVAGQRKDIKKRVRRLIFVMLGGVFVLGCVGSVWVFSNRAGNVSGSDVAFESHVRLAFWSMAYEQWSDYPLVGAGSRSYSYLSHHYWSPNLSTGEANPEFVHNEYLQILADYGGIGLALILALILGHIVVGTKKIRFLSQRLGDDSIREGSYSMALATAGVCGIVAMGVHIIFDFRTHLQANLLLLVCCAVWVLPLAKGGSSSDRKRRFNSVFAFALFVLGVSTAYLGGQQLWGGWPLLTGKLAREHGAWNVSPVNRGRWISCLEESVERVPHFRRYLKLGALYRLEAIDAGADEREKYLDLSIRNYSLAYQRHSYDLISRINIAKIQTDRGNFAEADEEFASISEVATSRERWFRMHSLWAASHLKWALLLDSQDDVTGAEEHYRRSHELYVKSRDAANMALNHQWQLEYTRSLLMYSRFLDRRKRFADSRDVYLECMSLSDWSNNGKITGLFVERGVHFYHHAHHLWFSRKPEEAAEKVKQSLVMFEHHRKVVKGKVNDYWQEHYDRAKEMHLFFVDTGVGQRKR